MTSRKSNQTLEKCPTGIRGLDEVLQGGLPRGRPTLVCGGAGSGKTLLAMEFIVRGARDLGEPGVFMAFEESEKELAQNVASLGFDLPGLIRRKLIAIDHVHGGAQRDRGNRRVQSGRALRAPGQHDQPSRGQAGGDRLARGALLRRCPTRASCAQNCDGCSAG